MAASAEQHIAIVGAAGRFPSANSLDEFHQVLKMGQDCVRPLDDIRRTQLGLEPGHYPETAYIDGIELFDCARFDMTPSEAERVDPEQRHLLELSFLALLDAAITPESLAGSDLGVFIGSSTSSGYGDRLAGESGFAHTGTMQALASGRISHWLNCNGPAEVINTACSSSLVAVLEAVFALRSGRIDRALAGAFNVYCGASNIRQLQDPLGIHSPGFRSRSFDAAADGIGVGEGGAMLVLMRLEDALANNENIHALIRGGAVTHDGRSQNGITAPNIAAQRTMYRKAWKDAGVTPADITYFEGHGTGTYLGDPIEYRALKEAIEAQGELHAERYLGSVKSNIGHLDNAAGVAGLLKCVASLKNSAIYPTVHFQTPNPHLGYTPEVLKVRGNGFEWPSAHGSCAGISAFGLSGTNAHLVLESAPERATTPGRGPYIVKLGARSPEALSNHMKDLAGFINKTDASLCSIVRSLNSGREDCSHRLAFVIDEVENFARALDSEETVIPKNPVSDPVRLVLLFGDRFEEFKQFEGHCVGHAGLKAGLAKLGLAKNLEELAPNVATFACQFALSHQLDKWGVAVSGIIGTGVGAITRKVIAGEFSSEEALELLDDHEGKPIDPQRFEEAVNRFRSLGSTAFVDMTPDGALVSLLNQTETGGAECGSWFNGVEGPVHRIAELYQRGVFVDWVRQSAIHDDHKVSVPFPRLEQIECWVNDRHSMDPGADGNPAAQPIEVEYSCRAWAPLAGSATPDPAVQTILMIGANSSFAMALEEGLIAEGLAVARWRPAETLQKPGELAFDAPVNAESASRIINSLVDTGRTPDRVILLPHLKKAETASPWKEPWSASVEADFDIVRAIGASLPDEMTGLIIIGAGSCDMDGSEEINLQDVFRRGLGRSITLEIPCINIRHIDVVVPAKKPQLTSLAKSVVSSVLDKFSAGYQCIALRNGRWFKETHAPAPDGMQKMPLQERPVVLITGGFGGLGLALAVSLAETRRARLVLLGRTSLEKFQSSDDSKALDVQAALSRIIAAGGEVLPIVADVSDRDALQLSRRKIEDQWGPIHGLIHAAGNPGGEMIRTKGSRAVADVAAPKIVGMENIIDVFGDCNLEFAALMSSMSTETGAIGQADYCAANLVLNTYASQLSHQRGWPVVAIAWDRWENTGMAQHAEQGIFKQRPGLTQEEGVAAFHHAISLGVDTVFVSKGAMRDAMAGPGQYENDSSFEMVADRDEVINKLIESAKELLQVDELNIDTDLFDLGADSMDLIELFHLANEIAPGRVSIHEVLLQPSIRKIVEQIFPEAEKVPAAPERTDTLNIVTLDL